MRSTLATLAANSMRERDLQESVRQMCRALNLPYYHTHDSRRSPEGWPDVATVVGSTLVLRELKAVKGKCTPAQIRWLDALAQCECVDVGLWTPAEWLDGTIERVLRNGSGAR